nr:MAG TPA: holin [Caudoviricetes sp.]
MVMTLNLNIYMKRKPKEMKKISFKNADGSLNGKLIAGIISLLIVLIQQVFAMFGVKFTGDWSAVVAVINTVLTILGMLGVITDVQTVAAPTVDSNEKIQVEATTNKVADEVQGPASTAAVADSSASSDTETTSESASQSGEKVV